MSFYWQQSLQSQDTGQPQQPAQQQQGQWDFINLGGAPAPQHQWNPAAQQQQNNYYYQQPQQQQHNGQVQHQQHQQVHGNHTQWNQPPVPMQQQQPSQHQQHPQLTQHNTIMHLPATEHTPILHQHQYAAPQPVQVQFEPTPPVFTPNQSVPTAPVPQVQQAHFPPPPIVQQPPGAGAQARVEKQAPPHGYQAPVPTPPVFSLVTPAPPPQNNIKKEEPTILTVAPPVATEQVKTKVTPTSSEDDWEKADMEVQRVDDENKTSNPTPPEKPEESRESSSLGGSWSQQEEPSERSSAEPVEILERPETVEEDKGEKTPRISMSENPEPTPTAPVVLEDRQETPEVQNASVLNSSSPGAAIATSTPKDAKFEKRASISSQGTIPAETPRAEQKQKGEKLQEENSGNNSDSTLASGKPDFERGHARASYREYKKTYMEICDRLKMMRSDSHHSDFRPSSKLANPLLAAAGLSRHPAIRRESTGGRNDGRASVPLPQSQSFSESPYQNGDRRGGRVSRLDPNARPSSRQSGYGMPAYDPRLADQRFVQQQPHQRYRHGRYSAMGVPSYRAYPQEVYNQRRPQSYIMEPYQNAYAQEPQETSSLSESEEDDENAESDDELRRYNMQGQPRKVHPDAQYQAQYQAQAHGEDGDALYYCGVVHVNMETWRRVKEKYPLPPEFFELDPIEKAAFMFYAVVYKQPYKDVDAFHKRFNREFYKYVCAGDSNDDALFKICRSMQDQYVARQQEKQAAYQQMKATLFSDDTSIDGQSEINSVYEESLNSCDTRNNGPLKFTHPHCFLNISTGGQIISILPEQSTSVVVFEDIKSILKDVPTLQVKEAAQTFKGPLIPHHTPPHTVRLYISKQIENIKRSAVAIENPEANDVVESLLVWQLLETMVKQQGNITGPDIAELLAKVASQPVNIEAPPQQSNITPALNQFTQFLLGGHIDEAVESAIRNGLFADALVLTRRLFPNDERRIEQIESRFLQTRSLSNPVTTLVTVAKGEAPPVLTNPPLDDHLSWRTHAAIILANLDQRGTAMNTIYQLGRALAKRDYHCAADFCFLVYCVLGGNNPFDPVQTPEGEEDYRRHISLVNSDIPDNESNPRCQYGFLITDLHATEIFDYALRLKPDRESPLAKSVEYQTARIKYAKLLANHGFNTDAYRYCTEIARSIWCHFASFNQDDLLELCDLAESLHFSACVDPSETQWIHDLRTMVYSSYTQNQVQQVQQEQQQQQQPVQYQQEPEVHHSGFQPEPVYEAAVEPLQPTPAPVFLSEPTPVSTPALEQHQQYIQEESDFRPPTSSDFSQQEIPTAQLDAHISYYPTDQEALFDQGNDFTASADYNDAPLTMASSPPVMETLPQAPQQDLPKPPSQQQPPAPTASESAPPPLSQHQPPPQSSQDQKDGWFKSIQNKVQRAIPGQNPMRLPDDKNPPIVWDQKQEKWVGDGVEQEPVAPPPPTMQVAPTSAIQGGGFRAARGASRYAQAGLGSSSIAAPSGMAPPMPMPTTFGFMPAPIDDDADSVDPFSGQANPTIQHSAQQPSDVN